MSVRERLVILMSREGYEEKIDSERNRECIILSPIKNPM